MSNKNIEIKPEVKSIGVKVSQSDVDYNDKVLEVNGLKKYFFVGTGKKKLTIPAVDGLSFDVYKREVFGLVGESGCGKTTTGRTIIKLYTPTEGTVDLNGQRIGAGYAERVRTIKAIRKQLSQDVLSLNSVKMHVIEAQKKAKQKIDLLKLDLKNLVAQKEVDLKAAKSVIDDYNHTVYKIKNDHVTTIKEIQYNAHLEIHSILAQTENKFEVEYKNQLKIAEIGYERKRDGLKDSAAIAKEVIQQRLVDLQQEYKQNLVDLEAKFKPLIEDEKVNILPKEQAKEQIKAVKVKQKEAIEKENAKFEKEKESIKKPDVDAYKVKVAQIKEQHQQKVTSVREQIAKIKLDLKEEVEIIERSETSELPKEEVVERTKQLRQVAKEKLDLEKEEIRKIKALNKAKETLIASQKMQMIFQDPISSLNPRMTVKEIIAEGLTIQGSYSDEEKTSRVAEVLDLVGLSPEYATRYPHEFSGGQRQRIGIARALIMNPNFIIADEPISALDVSIRAQVINLLTGLKEKLGLTILFIAHDLSVVRFFCDRIAVMYNGKIVELTTSKELFATPLHPYTESLLSAIPQPDPDYEKSRKRIHYKPNMHDYRVDKPSLKEVKPGHFVYCNDKEYAEIQKKLGQVKSAS